jgi:hypothetical protein
LIAIPSVFGANTIAWGPPTNGLRLGVNTNGPALRIVFQNDGIERDILLGMRNGERPLYRLDFRATAPNGKDCHVVYLDGPPIVAGSLEPIVVRLASGESYEVLLHLNKFIYFENQELIRLDQLFERRYSIRASFEVTPAPHTTDHSWLGKITSGDFSPSK